MVQVTADADRDPYKQFRFRLKWDGRIVAGFSRIHGLSHPTEAVTFRSGGDQSGALRNLPGQSKFDAVTLERGVTYDGDFAAWVNKVWTYDPALGHEASLQNFRKDVAIQLFNEAGQIAVAYDVYRCWPSEYSAMPELDGSGNAVAIQTLVLQNEGWERDASVKDPAAP
jgi:phage tail-like protein